ncbi:MAG: DUF4124 domain-containing protein [Cellvibrionaceae bacterium]
MLPPKGIFSPSSVENTHFFNTYLPTHRFFKHRVLFLFAILFCSSSYMPLATAEIYKWTDEKGKIHFSDKPPANKKAEDITESTTKTNVDTSQNEQYKLNKIFAKETEGEKQSRLRETQQAQKEKIEMKRRCTKAKKNLKFLREERFYTLDENGKENTMSERERNELAKEYNQLIKQNCG